MAIKFTFLLLVLHINATTDKSSQSHLLHRLNRGADSLDDNDKINYLNEDAIIQHSIPFDKSSNAASTHKMINPIPTIPINHDSNDILPDDASNRLRPFVVDDESERIESSENVDERLPDDWHSKPKETETETADAIDPLPNTDIQSRDKKKEDSKVIEWTLTHHTRIQTDGLNKAKHHYEVVFSALDVDVSYQCKKMDIQISINNDIHRKLESVHCDHLKFSILPGIPYVFDIKPTIFSADADKEVIVKPKRFEINEEVDASIKSFELALELKYDDYVVFNQNTKELSDMLTADASKFGSINKEHISIHIIPPYHKSVKASIKIVIAKIDENKAQIAIEKIKNMYYDKDKSMLLSDVVAKSKLLRVTALTSILPASKSTELKKEEDKTNQHAPKALDAVRDSNIINRNTERPTQGRMNVGVWLVLFVVVAISCFVLSRCSSEKFTTTMVDFCKILCILGIECIQRVKDCIRNSSEYMNVNNWNLSRATPRYDVLNISEELDKVNNESMVENESGIDLINQVFEEQNVASFRRESYIRILKENWITSIERLNQLNKEDWIRLGMPKDIQIAIMNKLQATPTNKESNNKPDTISRRESKSSGNLSEELEYPAHIKSPTFDATITIESIRPATNDGDVSDTSFSDF